MRHEYGFSLLEVLISVIILAVGLIGIAALQITTSVYSESSLHRGQASMLAREIIERMRVNLDQAKTGGYDISALPSLTQDCSGTAADCTPAEMGAHDLRVWSARLAGLLPSGDAVIATNPPADPAVDPAVISVAISWNERRSRGLTVATDEDLRTTQTFQFELFGVRDD